MIFITCQHTEQSTSMSLLFVGTAAAIKEEDGVNNGVPKLISSDQHLSSSERGPCTRQVTCCPQRGRIVAVHHIKWRCFQQCLERSVVAAPTQINHCKKWCGRSPVGHRRYMTIILFDGLLLTIRPHVKY